MEPAAQPVPHTEFFHEGDAVHDAAHEVWNRRRLAPFDTTPQPGEFDVPGRRLLCDRQMLRIAELESLLETAKVHNASLEHRVQELESSMHALQVTNETLQRTADTLGQIVMQHEDTIEELRWDLQRQTESDDNDNK